MKEKKRLMLLSPMLHQGGFERVCITTARIMEPYFDITIVIFDSKDIAYNVEGLHIIDINMGVKRGKIKKLLNIVRRSLKVRKLKKEMKPDIAYSFGPTANLVNAFSKTGREKVWLGLRNYTDVEETGKIRLFVKLADLMICCSNEIEKELKNKFRFNKTAVLYNLYDVKKIREEAGLEDPKLPFGQTDEQGRRLRYLVSMGRDDDMKGFWHMIKIFYLVHQKIPESRLILMGAGSFATYKKLAEDLNITDAIYFAGMQRQPYKYLKKGEIYLLTSGNEGFPNALVEGMSLSLAPVCVNCKTGPAEILVENGDTASLEERFRKLKEEGEKCVIYGDYGILLPVMDKERDLDPGHILQEERVMAGVVTELMENREKLDKYRKAASHRASCFTFEKYAERFLQLADR